EALETVERVADAEFWHQARSASHSVEAPFAATVAGQLTNGMIDLLYETEAGWQVIDYKTDRSVEEGRHLAQLDGYRNGLRAVGCSVADASVVSVRTDLP